MFIVLEGVDGCGKSTQAVELCKYFFSQGKEVYLTKEPTQRAKRVLSLLKKTDKTGELLPLFLEDREGHSKIISSFLDRDIVVICDRYYYSTYVYQNVPKERLNTTKILKPDITFVIDAQYKPKGTDVFDRDSKRSERRQRYLSLHKSFPEDTIHYIDGNDYVSEVTGRITSLLQN